MAESRRNRRKNAKKQKCNSVLPDSPVQGTAVDPQADVAEKGKPSVSSEQGEEKTTVDVQVPRPIGDSTMTVATATSRLLIVSIGNPGAKYAATRHNAGHMIAQQLQQKSLPASWTVSRSSVFMNESGREVRKILHRNSNHLLVVLHDDLEGDLGRIRLREGKSSAQGHNGIKSIQQVIPPTTDWWRIAIGIGRPTSRSQASVSAYVLSNFSASEGFRLRSAIEDVVIQLQGLERPL